MEVWLGKVPKKVPPKESPSCVCGHGGEVLTPTEEGPFFRRNCDRCVPMGPDRGQNSAVPPAAGARGPGDPCPPCAAQLRASGSSHGLQPPGEVDSGPLLRVAKCSRCQTLLASGPSALGTMADSWAPSFDPVGLRTCPAQEAGSEAHTWRGESRAELVHPPACSSLLPPTEWQAIHQPGVERLRGESSAARTAGLWGAAAL